MDIKKEINKIAKDLISKGFKNITIKPVSIGGYSVFDGNHTRTTNNPLEMVLGYLEYYPGKDIVINGRAFSLEGKSNPKNQIKRFFDTYHILEKYASVSRVSSKWQDVKSMTRDLDAMLDQIETWMEKEKDAVRSGKAAFDFTPYYRAAFDALEDTVDKFKALERRI